jgi:hypothetical protein
VITVKRCPLLDYNGDDMREYAEFRVDERYASLLFGQHEGQRLGDSVRKVEIATNDSRYARVGELQAELRRSEGEPFFYGWDLYRRYTAKELAAAGLLLVLVRAVFEPAGEECGTQYDESINGSVGVSGGWSP